MANINKRKNLRLELAPLGRIAFRMPEKFGAKTVDILNISRSGVGLAKAGDISWPSAGDSISGTLISEGQEYAVVLRVMHISASTIGCEFTEPASGSSRSVVGHSKKQFRHKQLRL